MQCSINICSEKKLTLYDVGALTFGFAGLGALITLTGFVVKGVIAHDNDFAKGRERGFQEGYQIGFHSGSNMLFGNLLRRDRQRAIT